MNPHMIEFRRYLEVERNASPHTVSNYLRDLEQFRDFLKTMGFFTAEELAESGGNVVGGVDRHLIRNYVATLRSNGLQASTISRKMSALSRFFKWLCRGGVITDTPMKGLAHPKGAKRLPTNLTSDDLRLLLTPDERDDFLACRNGVILELFYASGVRLAELVGMNDQDLRLDEGVIRIRGKRRKERMAFMGERVRRKLREYLVARDAYLKHERCAPEVARYTTGVTPVFINFRGGRITGRSVQTIVSKAVQRVGLQRHVSPHALRHTFATHLMDHGADLKHISELLGHEDLRTTQKYTHVDVYRLMKIYDEAHPRAKRQEAPDREAV